MSIKMKKQNLKRIVNKKSEPMGQPMGETSRCKICKRNHYADTMINGVCKNCR